MLEACTIILSVLSGRLLSAVCCHLSLMTSEDNVSVWHMSLTPTAATHDTTAVCGWAHESRHDRILYGVRCLHDVDDVCRPSLPNFVSFVNLPFSTCPPSFSKTTRTDRTTVSIARRVLQCMCSAASHAPYI